MATKPVILYQGAVLGADMSIKKTITLVLLIFLAGTLWVNRSEVLLTYIKYKTDTEFTIGPNKAIPWQTGPVEKTDSVRKDDKMHGTSNTNVIKSKLNR